MPDKSTDAQLLERANRGDEEAFLVLYRGHRDTVFRFAYRLLGSVEAAEDITQDCFLSALKHPERFDERRASLRTYLCAAARNLAMKHFRRAGREVALEETPEDFVYEHAPAQPLGKLLGEELSEIVRRAVAGLPPLQREALVLFEYEDFTLAEIAAITEADTGTIKARLYRARESLRRSLAPYFKAHEAAAEALEKH
ncbi:MAG: RNA polymerase sigma factor [Pyrinomonadaceae bacterium]